MDTFATAILATLAGIAAIIFFVILGTLFGALAGWIVGLFFDQTILKILSQLGVKGVTMWEFGAFMGFVGGFLKTKVSATVTAAK